jgi:hypothetical protein
MHPTIVQAVATQQSAEMRAHAAAARARDRRRARPAGPLAWFARIPTFRSAPQPVRDPEAA